MFVSKRTRKLTTCKFIARLVREIADRILIDIGDRRDHCPCSSALEINYPASRISVGHPAIEHNSSEIAAITFHVIITKLNAEGAILLDAMGCLEAVLLFVRGLETFGASCPLVDLERKVTT